MICSTPTDLLIACLVEERLDVNTLYLFSTNSVITKDISIIFLSAISRLFTIKIKIICCLFQPLCFEEFGLVAILRNDLSVRVYGCDDDVKYHLRRS